jgi:predicted DCC family thiol-disulfide oxidoreductase YuxK
MFSSATHVVDASAAEGGRGFEVFFDGDCPLCTREIAFLRKRDSRGQLRFTDIAAADFDAQAVTGRSQLDLMDRIHGRLPDGTMVEGVEVFRRLYGALGFRRLVSWSRAPGIAWLLDWAYRVFARNRLRLTGRCTPDSCRLPEHRRSPER